MADKNLDRAGPISLAHFPSLLLAVGYPCYWLDLYFFRPGRGQSSLLALILSLGLAGSLLWLHRRKLRGSWLRIQQGFIALSGQEKAFLISMSVLGLGIIGGALFASFLPPHLTQESDILDYHYPLARQHLILNSFALLNWNLRDLFIFSMQFALSPFWFVTALPNKFPQFLFLLGFLAVTGRLAFRFSARGWPAAMAVFAVLGSHNVGIQAGTGMLDIAISYLFLAAIDSLLSGWMLLAALEFAFFFWSKPLVPFFVLWLFFALWGVYRAGRLFSFWQAAGWLSPANGVRSSFHLPNMKKAALWFLVLSVFVAGPFLAKSWYYSGSPLYPFGVGMLTRGFLPSDASVSLAVKTIAAEELTGRDQYGHGRSVTAFVKHLWLIAVPERGVNNAYDYPLGLPFLLVLGPFVFYFYRSLRQKQFCLLPLLVVLYWLSWWMGSQQTRFLYIPLVLMFIALVPLLAASRIFLACLTLALALNFLSVFRAHDQDLGKRPLQILREKDLQVVRLNEEYVQAKRGGVFFLDGNAATFAQFPVFMPGKKTLFIPRSDR